jgi:hypothetical protein
VQGKEGFAFWTKAAPGPFAAFIAFLVCHALLFPCRVLAQSATVSEEFLLSGRTAWSFSAGAASVVQLQGPVTITLDNVKCSADNAVIWLTPLPTGLLAEQQADIVLLGHARLEARDNHLTRTSETLVVNAIVRGNIQLTVENKFSKDVSNSALYQQALAIRQAAVAPPPDGTTNPPPAAPLSTVSAPAAPASGGTNAAGVVAAPTGEKADYFVVSAPLVKQYPTEDGTRILVLSGGVSVTETAGNGDYLELLARDVVLFADAADSTQPASLTDLGHHFKAAYLEGDVRVDIVPAIAKQPEQRLTADRVYFDFTTKRAILTDVVFHAVDPASQTPIVIRAKTMQELSHNEILATGMQFTTSKFAVPTYSIGASYAYVHQQPDDKEFFDVDSRDDVFHVLGIPVFFWPRLWGTIDTRPFPLRDFSSGNSSRYGTTITSEWGLFETLGRSPPKGLDVDYHVDYFGSRGPGGGFDGNYKGGFITDTADPWDFEGDFKSYIMSDRGIDQLGGIRTNVDPPTELRGRLEWEHNHFFPDDWQLQLRLGYVSDPTFLQEYYQPEFDNALPYNAEFYVKRQRDTEVISFIAETDTTNFITNADRQQEQFDVARLPEIQYQRIGDSLLGDQGTLFSNTSGAALKFDRSDFSLAEQGYYPGLSPGLPSDGYTGTTGSTIYRGDTREEFDLPLPVGPVKIVPYVMGRVTAYSNSPSDEEKTRLFGGGGVRVTTTFWHVDDSVDSDLLDLHRIRHVIQPEVNFYSSATTVDQSQVYIFDPSVDAVDDITAASVALHQHWETMRGGPGRWQSVDILDLNLEGDFYPHQPPPGVLAVLPFRGLFFPSEPETSIARQSLNADMTVHLGDDTAFITDYQWDLDKRETAIAEAGVAVSRGSRLSYYIGDAYIQALESQVFTFNATYNLTQKYSINLNEALDFGQSRAAVTYLTVIRRFDTFAFSVSVYHDEINKVSGFNVNLFPAGQPGFSAPWRAND